MAFIGSSGAAPELWDLLARDSSGAAPELWDLFARAASNMQSLPERALRGV